jgi:hypothetical protein
MRANRVIQQNLQAWMIMEQERSAALVHHQQQQRPMMPIAHQLLPNNFGANANFYHRPGAMVPPSSLDNFYSSEAAQQYHHQRSRVPATSSEGRGSTVVSGGAGGEVSGANWDRGNGDSMEFVDSATAGGSASAVDGDGRC